jgi:hypothetical protein
VIRFSDLFVIRWAAAFVFTQIVEIPIYRRHLDVGFWAAFGASAITHPLVWLLLGSHAWQAPWTVQVTAAEVFAWLAEAAYFEFGFRRRGALFWSFVANAASLALGLVARGLFGWP